MSKSGGPKLGIKAISRRGLALLGVVALVFGSVFTASALTVTPVRMDFELGQGVQRGSFTVTNTQRDTIAVEVTAVLREQSQDGWDIEVPADADFVIIPPQMVLAPGEEQIVRIQWIADREGDQELAYRLNFDQVPIPFSDSGDNEFRLGVAYSFSTALYVSPPGSQAIFDFVGAQAVQIPNPALALQGEGDQVADGIPQTLPAINVTIANTGKRRGHLLNPEMTIRHVPSGNVVTLTEQQLGPFNGALLLAGAQVTAPMPWPAGLPFGEIEAEMTGELKTF